MPIHAAELIERKRNGEELSAIEISDLVLGYARGEIPDYQMAAWCMAVYFKGLSGRETHSLTDAMIRSGETLDLGKALGRRVVLGILPALDAGPSLLKITFERVFNHLSEGLHASNQR